jgi:hypothetical protein
MAVFFIWSKHKTAPADFHGRAKLEDDCYNRHAGGAGCVWWSVMLSLFDGLRGGVRGQLQHRSAPAGRLDNCCCSQR